MNIEQREAFDRSLSEDPDERERREIAASNEALLAMMGGPR